MGIIPIVSGAPLIRGSGFPDKGSTLLLQCVSILYYLLNNNLLQAFMICSQGDTENGFISLPSSHFLRRCIFGFHLDKGQEDMWLPVCSILTPHLLTVGLILSLGLWCSFLSAGQHIKAFWVPGGHLSPSTASLISEAALCRLEHIPVHHTFPSRDQDMNS